MTTDYNQKDYVQEAWDRVAETKDFLCLQNAYEGNIDFFKETEISSEELILPENDRGFLRFYNFSRSLAYSRAIEQASLQEDHGRARQLKLEARPAWIIPLKGIKRILAPRYVDSLVTRLHNLVTTGEERKTFRDRVLDWLMN